MNSRTRSLAILWLTSLSLLGAAVDLAAQDPELIVEIAKQEIYEGESVLYRVTVNHTDEPTAPVLAGFDDFEVTAAGEKSLDSRQITIINGRRSEVVRRGRQYNYRLRPLRSGKITIPAPTAKIGGVVLTGRGIALQVNRPDDQDAVILTFTADRSSLYPMQPFELTLTIAVKDLPGELNDRDPLTVQPKPPELDASWLSDNRIPDGIEPARGWREILEPLISRRGHGVQINNIGTSSVFSLFDSDATGFHPQPKRATHKDASGVDAGYWEYRFTRRLIPQKQGKYKFNSVTLKGTFADKMENGQLAGRHLYVVAPGLEVNVKEPPLEGRSDSYVNAIGSFEVQAEIAPTAARVGDPMTLTVTLTGKGTLAEARPPKIAMLLGVDGAFRTYDATEDSQAGARRFTYSLRPLNSDLTEFPKIPVSYFDVETEQYVTIYTDPIPITIRESETLTNEEIVSAPNPSTTPREKLEASEGGIFANESNLNSLRNEIVRPGRWLAGWAGMLVGWVAASLTLRRIQRIREDPSLLRKRSAAPRAQAALDDAAAQLASGAAAETCESLRRAITGLIADYADVLEAGLTVRDVAERLEILGVEESLRNRTQVLLNQCDAARYGAAANGATQLHSDASTIVGQLLTELRKSRRSFPVFGRAATALLVSVGLLAGGCGATPDLEAVRKFQAAEQAFQRATSPDEFARVANQYGQIGGDTFASGAVFYNRGNAWMRAGKIGHAIASYRQAQRYRPRDPYLVANLRNALTASGGLVEPESGPRVIGYVFFWQDWLSYREKFLLTTCLLAVVLIIALLSPRIAHPTVRHRLSLGFGLLCLLLALSTGWDWHRFDRTTRGVVTSREAIARKGNSESYQAAFTNPLDEGTEFVVLEKRNDWLHTEVGDSGAGWLRARDVETY